MLKIYGVPNSQPVRAVVWTCLIKQLPFEFVLTSQNRDAKQDEYLSKVNPRGTIPAIDDNGITLWESHAILIYLCEKHGWSDLWPDDLVSRALVNQYLHFHHRNTRELVIHWSRALWTAVFEVSDPDDDWYGRNTFPGLMNNAQVVNQTLKIVDGMLSRNAYLAGSAATVADIVAYEEIGQNQPKYANCLDYSDYSNIQRWLIDMEQLPLHAEAHEIWTLLGDVNKLSGGMKTVARANKVATATIQSAAAG